MGVLPLVEVAWRDRPPGVLLLLFWFETVLLLATGAVRIVVHRRATGKAGHHAPLQTVSDPKADAAATARALGDGNTYLRGFLGLGSVFTAAHGVFVLAIVFAFEAGGAIGWQDAKAALLYVVAVQAIWLLWDLPRIPAWSFRQLGRATGQANLRIVVTQVGLVVGMVVTAFTGSAWGLVGTFVALRALVDASLAWLEGLLRRQDLPPGVARFLSRRSKQSVASLEAEFDVLRDHGHAVEALLEKPFGDVRVP